MLEIEATNVRIRHDTPIIHSVHISHRKALPTKKESKIDLGAEDRARRRGSSDDLEGS